MSEFRRNLLVGFFMLAGLGTAATLMVLFGEHPTWLGGAEYELSIRVNRLSGVQEGTPIHMNGVEVGRVGRVEFVNAHKPYEGVKIIALIRNQYDIPKGTRAVILSSPIGIGRTRIELAVSITGDELIMLPREGAGIRGEMGNPLADILPPTLMPTLERTGLEIGNLAADLRPVASDLHDLLEKRTVGEVDDPAASARRITATLHTVVQRFDETLRHWNDIMGDPEFKAGVRQSVENIRDMTADGKQTFADLRETAATLKTDVRQISDELQMAVQDARGQINRLGPVLDGTAELAGNLNRVAVQMAEGEGTLGLLLRDARLYEAMRVSLERLTDLIDSLRRLAAKFERQGYVEFKYHSVVGPVKGTRPIPEE